MKIFVRQVRVHPEPDPIVRSETPPGHQAQVDFAEFRLPWGKRYALLIVLGYSRLMWLGFFPRQDITVNLKNSAFDAREEEPVTDRDTEMCERIVSM